MKKAKLLAVVLCGALAASLALFGCSSGSNGSEKDTKKEPAAAESSYTLLNDGKLVVATSPDYPPFENLEGNEYVGFDIEFAKALGKELGLEVEFKTLQFDAIIPAVAAGGQCDIAISGFSVDPERAEQIDFTSPYFTDDQAIAVMKDSGVTSENVDATLNAADAIIAVQSGTTGEDFARENYPAANIQPYGSATDCFAAMQSGKANAVCMNKAVVDKMLAGAYTNAVSVKSVATGEEYAVVVSKDNPELTKAINEAIAKLESDGTIEDLKAQYLG